MNIFILIKCRYRNITTNTYTNIDADINAHKYIVISIYANLKYSWVDINTNSNKEKCARYSL